MAQKTKNVAFEKFLEETNLKPCNLWAGEALEAQTRGCLNITFARETKVEKKRSVSGPPLHSYKNKNHTYIPWTAKKEEGKNTYIRSDIQN